MEERAVGGVGTHRDRPLWEAAKRLMGRFRNSLVSA